MSAETDHGLRTVPMPMNQKRTARLDGIQHPLGAVRNRVPQIVIHPKPKRCLCLGGQIIEGVLVNDHGDLYLRDLLLDCLLDTLHDIPHILILHIRTGREAEAHLEEIFLTPTETKAPTNAPTIFITKSVNSKNPTFKTNWRLSIQRDSPKPARVARPSRRPGRSRLADARNSERKSPNGTKTATLQRLSACPRPVFWNIREKSSVRLCPVVCFIIPQYRIPTAVSSKNRPMKTVSPNAIAQYTNHFLRIRRIIVTANDTTNIATQCHQGT